MNAGFKRLLALLADPQLTLADIEESLVAGPDRELRNRCALARYINQEVLEILSGDRAFSEEEFDQFRRRYLRSAPSAAEEPFCCLPREDVDRLAPRWRSLRLGQDSPSAPDRDVFQRINHELARYFRELEGDWDCEVLYHSLPLLPEDKRRAEFLSLYEPADKEFQLARCSELLAVLAESPPTKDTDGKLLHDKKQRRLNARLEFAGDYYGTLRYLDRPELHREFLSFLNAKHDGQWLLQLWANGGMGKTMFVRWMLARKCALDGIPCARVDFDDLPYAESLRGWEVIARFLNQLGRQIPDSSLSYVETELKDLSRQHRGAAELDKTAADDTALHHIQRIGDALHSSVDGPVLLILDTTEEALLRNKADIRNLFAMLEEIHSDFPRLRVVCSGRIDLSENAPASVQLLEMGPFTDDESKKYLAQRGLADDPRVSAIVKRSGGVPFKLALFADLLQSGSEIKAKEILEQDKIDILYLIERIIKRIEDPAVRWLVRYGALAKRLTIEFLDEVILKFIHDVREGWIDVELDDPQLDSQYLPKTLRDEGLYHWSDAQHVPAVETLWAKLKVYANDSSWVRVPKDAPDALTFHEVVVRPMRSLVSQHRIFDSIHDSAIQYFDGKCRSANTTEQRVWATRTLLFHHFQRSGDAARATWEESLKVFKEVDASLALQLAEEITEPDYYDDQAELPITLSGERQVISQRTLATAFFEQARFQATLGKWGPVEKLLDNARRQEQLAGEAVIPADALAVLRAELAWSRGRPEETLSVVANALDGERELGGQASSRLRELQGDALETLHRVGAAESLSVALQESDHDVTRARIAHKILNHHLRCDRYEDAVRIGGVRLTIREPKEESEQSIENIRMTARALLASGQPQAAAEKLKSLTDDQRSSDDVLLHMEALYEMGIPRNLRDSHLTDWHLLAQFESALDFHSSLLLAATRAAALHRFRTAREHFEELSGEGIAFHVRGKALASQAKMELMQAGNLNEAKHSLNRLAMITLEESDPSKIQGQVLWAALFHAWEGVSEARDALERLQRQGREVGFGPGVQAQIEMAYLAYTSPTDPKHHVHEMLRYLEQVQGITARARMLDIVIPYRGWPDRLPMLEPAIDRLLPVERDELEALRPLDRALYWVRAAKLHWLLGRKKAARRALEMARQTYLKESTYFPLREVFQAEDYVSERSRRVPVKPKGFVELLEQVADEPVFRFTVLLEQADRLYCAGNVSAARQLRDVMLPLLDAIDEL